METNAAQNFFTRVWNSFITAFRYYAAYSGRCSRFDFWSFTIINGLINICLTVLSSRFWQISFVYFLYSLISFSPSAAVGIRRYHDSGLNAWIFFAVNLILAAAFLAGYYSSPVFFIVALFLVIVNLYIMLRKGDLEANQFGLPGTLPAKAFETAGSIVFALYLLLSLSAFVISSIQPMQ